MSALISFPNSPSHFQRKVDNSARSGGVNSQHLPLNRVRPVSAESDKPPVPRWKRMRRALDRPRAYASHVAADARAFRGALVPMSVKQTLACGHVEETFTFGCAEKPPRHKRCHQCAPPPMLQVVRRG